MEIALKIRNVLFKCFVISFVILIATHLFYVFNSDFIVKVFENIYHISEQNARLSIVLACNAMKIITVMFFLIPAAAIHCEFIKCKCEKV